MKEFMHALGIILFISFLVLMGTNAILSTKVAQDDYTVVSIKEYKEHAVLHIQQSGNTHGYWFGKQTRQFICYHEGSCSLESVKNVVPGSGYTKKALETLGVFFVDKDSE